MELKFVQFSDGNAKRRDWRARAREQKCLQKKLRTQDNASNLRSRKEAQEQQLKRRNHARTDKSSSRAAGSHYTAADQSTPHDGK
eukprot:1614528-Amphidinium_carterae.2